MRKKRNTLYNNPAIPLSKRSLFSLNSSKRLIKLKNENEEMMEK